MSPYRPMGELLWDTGVGFMDHMAYIRILNLTISVPYFSPEWSHNFILPLVQEGYCNFMFNFPIFATKKNMK